MKENNFEDIISLDERLLHKILRGVDSRDLALALNATSEQVQEKIFNTLTEPVVPLLKELMSLLQNSHSEDSRLSQEKIVSLWQTMNETED
ncbi:MAG: hypothetical protein KBF99_17330 [Leptospiraceae bacterium]|nr:hypothetical protein [Leptospiraceae bacterium]MBK7056624.1 hypothetical protein [Leptospiraceae bacterium]MBK9501074.1 hypothetical protein [Leptospiraceae bacterium]MBP9164945.1 hypothetical protein [Leptospiraceae bacterium]